MSEIIVNLSSYGNYSIKLDLYEPAPEGQTTDVWGAVFCDTETEDCEIVYFEMDGDYELWDIINEAIHTYRIEISLDDEIA